MILFILAGFFAVLGIFCFIMAYRNGSERDKW